MAFEPVPKRAKNPEEVRLETEIAKVNECLDATFEEVRRATQIYAVLKPMLVEERVFSRYENTLAGNAFLIVRQQLIASLIMTIARIWDDGDDCRSLTSAHKFFAKPSRQQAFLHRFKREQIDGGRAYQLMVRKEHGDEAAKAVEERDQKFSESLTERCKSRIDKFRKYYTHIQKKKRLKSLQSFRTEVLAHNIGRQAEVTRLKSVHIPPLKRNDLTRILNETAVVMLAAYDAIGVSSKNSLIAEPKVWSKYAEEFWAIENKN